MIVERSIDIEDEIWKALKDYFNITTRPLPKEITKPLLLVTTVGGSEIEKAVNAYEVVLDARAATEEEAINLLLDAVATLDQIAKNQNTPIAYVVNTSSASWGKDPVRDDLALCSARMTVYAHKTTKNIEPL